MSNLSVVPSDFNNQKSNGVVYTPKGLADFVAKKIIKHFNSVNTVTNNLRILDPSVGDGVLILSVLENLNLERFEKIEVFAFDIDDSSFLDIERVISERYDNIDITLRSQDFLEYYVERDETEDFDLIIANPPYVRNQVLGSDKSQKLSKIFDTKGKVDIYYIFMLALSNLLSEFGFMGTITSNRFLSIKSGKVVRDYLLDNLDIKEIYDLGDTKLFEGIAVLPALVFSQNKTLSCQKDPIFKTIYETTVEKNTEINAIDSIVDIINLDDSGVFSTNGRFYDYKIGVLEIEGSKDNVWTISNKETKEWISAVEKNTWKTFKDISKTRVGVKSTADKIFIRTDWDDFENPPELLRELITSQYANPFHAKTPKKKKRVIYPHIIADGKKSVVNLEEYPNSKLYFEEHKEKLSSRKYLIDAGRAWYSLWVPHSPELWEEPKIVFHDISEKPKFWIDLDGRIVNGECYWIILDEEADHNLLWLCLAVANSTFIEKYYDHKFNNKLYSGKRRFMKQYVEQFPLPDPNNQISKNLAELAKEIALNPSKDNNNLIDEVNKLVFKVFGVD
jgi:adenine-specific DNA-methyltransferase